MVGGHGFQLAFANGILLDTVYRSLIGHDRPVA